MLLTVLRDGSFQFDWLESMPRDQPVDVLHHCGFLPGCHTGLLGGNRGGPDQRVIDVGDLHRFNARVLGSELEEDVVASILRIRASQET